MNWLADPVAALSNLSFLCVFLALLALMISIFRKLWWTPIRMKRFMGLQGIKGPSYRLIHGSTKEISRMRKEAMARPMNLSNDIWPAVKPHGKNYLQSHSSRAPVVKKVSGDGVGVSKGEKWPKLRELANQVFGGDGLKSMVPTLTTMNKPKSSHDIFSQVQPHIHLWTKLYGKNFLQSHGAQAQLVITEPEMCKEILNNKDGAFRKTDTRGYVKKLLGDGLTRSSGEKWSKLRKLANHAFHGESLKSMIPAMVASGETMLERFKNLEGEEIEVCGEFRLFTSEVISRTAFGTSFLEGKNIFDMLMKLSALSVKNSFKVRFPGISKIYKTRDEIESVRLEKGIRDNVMDVIDERERKARKREEQDGFGSDFLGLLLKAHHDVNENQRISVDDLVDECKTFYLAGQETTSTLLAWTMFLLALHPDWQEEARKEVIQLSGKNAPIADFIAKLRIMSMIINESLRLYPPIISLERKALREVRVGKVIIPADVELQIPNLAFHHDSQLWGQDVKLFKPERFSGGVAKATKNNIAAFFPFGMGPRHCVGMNFATTEVKIGLSMILQHYSFTLSPGYVHSPFHFLTVRPQHGIQIILNKLV